MNTMTRTAPAPEPFGIAYTAEQIEVLRWIQAKRDALALIPAGRPLAKLSPSERRDAQDATRRRLRAGEQLRRLAAAAGGRLEIPLPESAEPIEVLLTQDGENVAIVDPSGRHFPILAREEYRGYFALIRAGLPAALERFRQLERADAGRLAGIDR